MKLLTKEEEQAHYRATLKGGLLGGVAGLTVGVLGVLGAQRRYPAFRSLTLPLKAFLITSSGTFAGIVSADHASRAFEAERNPLDKQYIEREREREQAEVAGLSFTQRALDWARRERYKIVMGSWVVSIATAFHIVNRNKYLTAPQKIVQARVYAQFLTLGVLVATAAFEISDSKNDEGKLWETVRVIDPNDPEHKRMIEKKQHKEEWAGEDMWKDMVQAEEQRLKERERGEKKLKEEREKHHPKPQHKSEGDKKSGKEDSKKGDGKDDKDKDKDEEDDDEEEKKKEGGSKQGDKKQEKKDRK